VTGKVKYLTTGAIVAIAIIAVLIKYWDYVTNPWTRDGQVRKVNGVRSFILAFFPEDIAHRGVVQPKVVGDFFLPVAMFEMRGAHGAVTKGLVGAVCVCV
jgi:hypothetical protein